MVVFIYFLAEPHTPRAWTLLAGTRTRAVRSLAVDAPAEAPFSLLMTTQAFGRPSTGF